MTLLRRNNRRLDNKQGECVVYRHAAPNPADHGPAVSAKDAGKRMECRRNEAINRPVPAGRRKRHQEWGRASGTNRIKKKGSMTISMKRKDAVIRTDASAKSKVTSEEQKIAYTLSYIRTAICFMAAFLRLKIASGSISTNKRRLAAGAASKAATIHALCAVGECFCVIGKGECWKDKFPSIPWSKLKELRDIMFHPRKLIRKLHLYGVSTIFFRQLDQSQPTSFSVVDLFSKLTQELRVIAAALLKVAQEDLIIPSSRIINLPTPVYSLFSSSNDFTGINALLEFFTLPDEEFAIHQTRYISKKGFKFQELSSGFSTKNLHFSYFGSAVSNVDPSVNVSEQYFSFLVKHLRNLPHRPGAHHLQSGKASRKSALWHLLTAPRLTDSLQFINRSAATLWGIEITSLCSKNGFKIHEKSEVWRNCLAHQLTPLNHPQCRSISIRFFARLLKNRQDWTSKFKSPLAGQQASEKIFIEPAGVDKESDLAPDHFLAKASKRMFNSVQEIIKSRANSRLNLNETHQGRTLLHMLFDQLLENYQVEELFKNGQQLLDSKGEVYEYVKTNETTLFDIIVHCLQRFPDARVDISNEKGQTVVCLFTELSEEHRNKLLKTLCQANFDDNPQKLPVARMMPFLAKIDVNTSLLDKMGHTFLHLAAMKDHVELVEYLLHERINNPADPLVECKCRQFKLPLDKAALIKKKSPDGIQYAACLEMLREETEKRRLLNN